MNETVYSGIPRKPVARKVSCGNYLHLKELSGRDIAIYDSSCNRTYDGNRKFVGDGNMLDRYIPR